MILGAPPSEAALLLKSFLTGMQLAGESTWFVTERDNFAILGDGELIAVHICKYEAATVYWLRASHRSCQYKSGAFGQTGKRFSPFRYRPPCCTPTKSRIPR